jgi:hypothetical protein
LEDDERVSLSLADQAGKRILSLETRNGYRVLEIAGPNRDGSPAGANVVLSAGADDAAVVIRNRDGREWKAP